MHRKTRKAHGYIVSTIPSLGLTYMLPLKAAFESIGCNFPESTTVEVPSMLAKLQNETQPADPTSDSNRYESSLQIQTSSNTTAQQALANRKRGEEGASSRKRHHSSLTMDDIPDWDPFLSLGG